MTPELIKQRYTFLVGERKPMEYMLDDIRTFIAPYRGEFFRDITDEQAIQFDYPEIYDGTGIQSNINLASNLHGNLTSPYIPWFSLQFRSEELNDNTDARAWLEEVAILIWNTLQESNFSREIGEAYLDLTTFGTACLVEEVGSSEANEWDGINFSCIPIKQMYFEERPDGTVSHFYRGYMMTPLQFVEKFGEKGVPDDILEKSKGATASSSRELCIFCIYPRTGNKVVKGDERAYAPIPPKRRAYGYKYIRGNDGVVLGEEGGYYEMPAFITRWSRISESRWGHGPSHVALFDVKTLNRQEELTLQALAKVVDPPQKTTERGLIGDLDMRPAGLTVLRNMGDLAPIESGTEWRAVDMERQNRRNMIREYYLVSKLDLKDSPAMTATEVERRWQQMQKLLGPTLGRLQADLLEPLIETCFKILMRAGRVPEIPSVVMEGESELEIEFTGPMPLAQKADAAMAIEAEFAMAAQLSQAFGPEVMDVIDAPVGMREHARMKGVPAKMIRSEAKVRKMAEERKAAAAQQQQLQAAEAASKTMGHVAGAAKDGAEAQMMQQQMGGGAAPTPSGGDQQEAAGGPSNVIPMPGAQAG